MPDIVSVVEEDHGPGHSWTQSPRLHHTYGLTSWSPIVPIMVDENLHTYENKGPEIHPLFGLHCCCLRRGDGDLLKMSLRVLPIPSLHDHGRTSCVY